MKKRAKKAKALKRARPATRGPARSTEVSGIARPAAELFVKGVLARGEAAKAVKGKLPPGVHPRTHREGRERPPGPQAAAFLAGVAPPRPFPPHIAQRCSHRPRSRA